VRCIIQSLTVLTKIVFPRLVTLGSGGLTLSSLSKITSLDCFANLTTCNGPLTISVLPL
jgi:hypothetical protein